MSSSFLPWLDALIESFLTPSSIPIIQGKPTYPQLTYALNSIKADAASIPSNQGRGANRHLGSVISDVVYATVASGNPSITPNNPTQHHTIPPNSMAAAISTIIRWHKENLQEWKGYNNIQHALKKELVIAINKMYLEPHNDNKIGYKNITIHVLL
jgi:hypothetical protein